MTFTPSELAHLQDSRDLLDAALRAAGVYLDPPQYDRALGELEAALDMLKRRWERSYENSRRPQAD